MKSISISNISTETLKNVHEIYASLDGNGIASVATKTPIPFVVVNPGEEIPSSVSIQLVRDDNSPFTNIKEAREALQAQPVRGVLSELDFTTNPSESAMKFITAFKNLMGESHHDPVERSIVQKVSQAAELNTEQLSSVLIELDERVIDVHDGGMISLRPKDF